MTELAVHFLVPDGIDDPERVSGGNVYDRRVADELRPLGFDVRMLPLAVGDASALERALSALPDDALVLVDGLLAVEASAALTAAAGRLRLVVLAHMVASALAETTGAADAAATAARERDALRAARRVITTSAWTRSELAARGLAESARITVARPGVDAVPAAAGSAGGLRLLAVGAVAPHKGQDVLVDALAGLAAVPGWSCTIVGSPAVDPDFAARTTAAIAAAGLSRRITLAGVLTGEALAAAYASADLLVAPSRSESYGMAVAEALARGIPVVAAHVGGVPEAIGSSRAGILVPPDDAWALRAVLRHWFEDAAWRAQLAGDARRGRMATRGWGETAAVVANALRATDATATTGTATGTAATTAAAATTANAEPARLERSLTR